MKMPHRQQTGLHDGALPIPFVVWPAGVSRLGLITFIVSDYPVYHAARQPAHPGGGVLALPVKFVKQHAPRSALKLAPVHTGTHKMQFFVTAGRANVHLPTAAPVVNAVTGKRISTNKPPCHGSPDESRRDAYPRSVSRSPGPDRCHSRSGLFHHGRMAAAAGEYLPPGPLCRDPA